LALESKLLITRNSVLKISLQQAKKAATGSQTNNAVRRIINRHTLIFVHFKQIQPFMV
jgi:hypothetical protein